MLIYDANSSWRTYYEYLAELFWKGYIDEDDWDLSKKHGKLYKDGKPYIKGTDDPRISTTYLPWSATKFPTATCMNLINNYQKSKTMESVKVTPPEGYEIDPSSTASEIFFRKKDDRPRKWSDLGDALGYEIHPTHLGTGAFGAHYRYNINERRYNTGGTIGKSLWPTKELAEAALALSELMQYRQRWIGDWEPDWTIPKDKYSIIQYVGNLDKGEFVYLHKKLSFPSREMRDDFLNTFKDLLETAKPLL